MATPLIPQEIYLLERYTSLKSLEQVRDAWREMLDYAEVLLDHFMRKLPPDYRNRPRPKQPERQCDLALRTRVELPVDFAQASSGDVRVNFRGADGGVAEQFLDHPQVGAVFEQVRGETVPQHVRRNVARDAGEAHARLDAFPQTHGGEGAFAAAEKDV